MRAAFFADSHGNADGIRDAVEKIGPVDVIVHLGDGVEDGRAVAEDKGLPYYCVSGNEDRACLYDDTCKLETGTASILLIHGHQVDINPYEEESILESRYEQLAYMARRSKAHILMFGHTHVPLVRVVNNIILCNPGSMYRGSLSPVTFGLFEICRDSIIISVYAKAADGNWETSSSFAEYNIHQETGREQ
jgi:uncharacterized protein